MWDPASRILAIGPHPDDIELGMGATLSRFCRVGMQVQTIILSTAEQSLPSGFTAADIRNECLVALSTLGIESTNVKFYDFPVRHFSGLRQEILEVLVRVDQLFKPDLVFCPSLTDTHQDHKVVAEECQRAFRTRSLLGYELPWNNHGFLPTLSSLVSVEDIDNKETALTAYRSQTGRTYFEPGLLKSMARLRATVTHSEFAESFEVIRAVIR